MGKAAQAPKLRTRLFIQRQKDEDDRKSRDDWKHETPIWQDIGVIMAKIEWRPGRERFDADQMVAIQECRITARFKANLQPTDRLVDRDGNRIFHIHAITNFMERGHWMFLDCVVAQ